MKWETKPFSEVVDILDSRRVPVNSGERAKRFGDVPYYGATGQVGFIDKHIFDEELVLLGEDGAPFLDSKKPKAYLIHGKSWVNNHAHVLRGKPGLLNSFLLYQLNNLDYRPYVSGTTRLKLPQGPMKQIPLLVPHEAEQRRIVAEIEKQFTRLEAGVAALRRVQANLKRYRAAVLKAACEGCLVPAQGSWCFTELCKVVTFLQGLQVPVPDQRFAPAEGDVPFLRIVNYTQPDKDFRYITDPGAKYHVQNDDVVMVRYGTPGFVGRGFEGVIANNLFRVIPQPSLSKNYLFYFLKSKAVADLIRSRQKGGTMQAISFGQLKDIPVSIPPLAEQTRIVAEVERRLSVVEELESVVTANLQRATRLRQSILQKAFAGNL